MSPKLPRNLADLSVSEQATLRTVLAAIETGGQEIAFVLDSTGRVVGTLTDGDVRRALLKGSELDSLGVGKFMSRSFHSVPAQGSHRANALDQMRAYGISQVPVLDDNGQLVGLHVISEYLDRAPLPNWALILAGGQGTRLWPITEHIPKPMVTVAGRPILERLILELVGSGIQTIHISVNYKKEVIKDFFGDGSNHGCAIRYLDEDRPLGTGGPLRLLPEVPKHPVILMNGDLVGDFQLRNLVEFHTRGGYAMTIGVGLHRYFVPFGVVDRVDDQVRSIREKPAEHWWINYGIYAVSPEVIGWVKPDVEFPITDLVQICLDKGRTVGAFELTGEWQDVGRPQDLAAARGLVE